MLKIEKTETLNCPKLPETMYNTDINIHTHVNTHTHTHYH